MGVSENLKRGVTEIVLLALLSQQDMYGYEMAQAMRERSHEKFTYYHLEPAGRAYFQKIFAEYMTVQQGVQEILASCQKEVTDIEP